MTALALSAAGCGADRDGSKSDSADAQLVALRSVDQLRMQFVRDRGRPRVLLLLSPT